MKLRTFLALAGLLTIQTFAAEAPLNYASLKAEAEKFYAEKSFSKAHELYQRAMLLSSISADEARWVAFRFHDTQWRAAASTQSADDTKIEQARAELEKMVRDVKRAEDRDRVWVEVRESLGDFHWQRNANRNWHQAWQHYQQALDWWAGARDIELARERYLAIVWRCAKPPGAEPYYHYGYFGNFIEAGVLENALKIAKSEQDLSHAHYLLAMTLRNRGTSDAEQRQRVQDEFEAALNVASGVSPDVEPGILPGGKGAKTNAAHSDLNLPTPPSPNPGGKMPPSTAGRMPAATSASGAKTDWYDDALFNYAQWIAGEGRVVFLKDGSWRAEPDYVRALELYRRLVTEFKKGETRYWEQAQSAIKDITGPQLNVMVSDFFMPGSEIQYSLNWRNVKQFELALYPVELNRDVKFGDNRRDWVEEISLTGREKLKSWTYDTARSPGFSRSGEHGGSTGEPPKGGTPNEEPDYKPGNATVRLDEKLPPGAYVLEGKAGGKTSRQLILVTDAALVLKSSGKQALVYYCDAVSGAPLANAKVVLRERWHWNGKWNTREQTKETDADGLVVFDLERHERSGVELFASAMLKDKQAFSTGNTWRNNWREGAPWKIYAFTDRPAYRPKETVQWKFIARRYADGVYSTPANQTVEFQINDPRGTKVKEGKATMNSFGSAWGSLELTEQMPLGEYHVQFWDEGRKSHIGNATLFRLEEYKLPEFKVAVSTPEEDGKKKTFRLGDVVEVTVQADYYFGGPVANANVEVVVNQNPYWQHWPQPREFPWFYEDMDQGGHRGRGWGGGGQIVKRETLKTDATGKATLTFETPRGSGQDLEYRIEARVTDSSRREIVGSGTVRVTRQRYFVHADADHRLYQPQDKVAIQFKAADANQQPVVCEGTVKVTRDYWWEIWIAPDGREVKGDELKQLRGKIAIWPPPPTRPTEPGWRLKFRGYEHDEILTKTLKTDTNGAVQLEFKPEREGYYRIAWTSEEVVGQASRLSGGSPEKSAAQVSVTPTGQAGRLPHYIKAEATVWVCTGKSTDLGYRTGGLEIIVDKDTFRVGQKAPVMIQTPDNGRFVLFTVEADELLSAKLIRFDGTVKLVELDVAEQHVPNMFLNAAMVSGKQLFTDSKQVVVPPTKNFLTVDVKPDRAQYQPREEGTFTVTTRDHEGKPVAAEVALSLVDESVFYIQGDYAGDPRQFYFGTKREQTTQTGSTFNQRRYVKLVRVDDVLIDESQVEAYELRKRSEREFEELLTHGLPKTALADSDAGVLRYRQVGGSGGGGGGRGDFSDRLRSLKMVSAMALGESSSAAAPTSLAMNGAGAVAMDAAKQETGGAPESAVVVRSDFRSTILWQPDVATGADGRATVKVKYPDSLTGWKATARAVTGGNQFGIADATTRTKQPLIVRLQAPRFFVVGDTLTISAVVNNNTEKELRVGCSLNVNAAKGLKVENQETGKIGVYGSFVKVPANGEARIDWQVSVKAAGDQTLRIFASAEKFSDAMEKSYIAHDHGIEKFIAKSGKVRGDDVMVKLDLPARKADSTRLTVQVTPSLAVTMLDALPYLIDYPYGCTEQTMSRFLPATIVARTLKDAGLQPEDVMGRVFGGIEQRAAGVAPAETNRSFSGTNKPDGSAGATPAARSQKNLAQLDEMTKAGLDRLYDFQHGDGGWGWWKEGQSDHWMTAYVVWGLWLAKQAGVAVKPEVARRGAAFLDKTLVEQEENHDMQAFMLHALAAHKAAQNESGLSKLEAKAFDNLWANREKLNAYTRSLLALSAHYFGKTAEARTLIENLENGVKRDDRPDASVLIDGKNIQHSTFNAQHPTMGTAHWGEDGIYWRWSDGGVEATAFALRALLAIDPTNKLVEPVANWLIKNRRGAQWSNTRDTAIVVLAMTDYLKVSGEIAPELEYVLSVNGTKVASKKVSGADVFNAPSRFEVDAKLIKDSNEIRIQVKPGKPTPNPSKEGNKTGGRDTKLPSSGGAGGGSPVYFAVEAKFFSLEEPITAAGNEIFVKREYFKLVGRPTLLKGYVYDKEPLRDGETVKSGERVETVITIEGKNNYEYLVFEDLKPAGFEAVEIRSGESLFAKELKSGAVERKHGESAVSGSSSVAPRRVAGKPSTFNLQPSTLADSDYTSRTRWVYQELRDRKVAMFVDKLPEGVWEIRYDLRAEVPGEFHALPVLGHAMYVPEIRCNGAELRVKVTD